ncbi:MAG TPA: HAMP domain-containing sensor histidine kinase [Gemmatimonadaceae bacterium]|nr:HAMP domain-containing sensor histidine kinase [Gemmatimonadaceae bacterium]
MRRSAPVVLVTLGLLALLGSYVWYTQRVVVELGREARLTAGVISRVYAEAASTSPSTNDNVMFDIQTTLQDFGIPMIVTDSAGRVTAANHLPFENSGPGDPRVTAYVDVLDRQNPPVGDPRVQLVHFGRNRLAEGLNVIPVLQVALVVLLIGVGAVVLRTRSRADRERVWAGMAREAAHQLGTPLSSLSGWVELLRDHAAGDARLGSALPHIAGDVERLERVAHRFERIGRPPKREPVDVTAVVTQLAAYFRERLPTLAHAITIGVTGTTDALVVPGDRVLLEWAIESLVKNAVDALSGRGGAITISLGVAAGGGVTVRVADDGPGIPPDMRAKVFAAGFTTKESGWGIGLPLARRIVEEAHGGRLVLVPSDRGAVFDVILPG